MAARAIQRRCQMRDGCILLALWRNTEKAQAVAVTACAIVDDAGVIHRRPGEHREFVRRVAGLARQAGRQVVHRLGHRSHTKKHLTVVATCAIAGDTGMVHRRSGEHRELARLVTSLACQAGRQMVARLGYRCHTKKHLAVVATCAIADDTGMNHGRPGKCGELARCMAGLARRAGRQVVCRLGYRCHTGKYLTVVAACTTAEDAGMAHRRTGEHGELVRCMAGLARRAGRQMFLRLGHRCHTGKYLPVVAAGAIAEDAGVAHCRPGEHRELARQVTSLARRAGRQMVAWLGDGRYSDKNLAVMAARAITEDTGMVHHPRPCSETGSMARGARLSRGQVVGRQSGFA
jgi:hypothetical protein